MRDHIVLAGHTGRLMARAGLLADTRYEVDQKVIETAIAASQDLHRPITGPELFDLWDAAHTVWTQLQPTEQERTFALIIRIADRMTPALKAAAAAADRLRARVEEIQGGWALAAMAANAHSHTVLPDWITDPETEEPPSWL